MNHWTTDDQVMNHMNGHEIVLQKPHTIGYHNLDESPKNDQSQKSSKNNNNNNEQIERSTISEYCTFIDLSDLGLCTSCAQCDDGSH